MPSDTDAALFKGASDDSSKLQRALDWRGAFWVAAGVPPLVLFSIGGIAGVAGQAAFVVWIVSMIMGFSQSFTYAEIAGMFGNKSGGASVYGATAWLRYSKMIAPLSVWCNWFAWSPVLSLGCAIAAGYILNALFAIPAADSQLVLDWIAANGAQFTADGTITMFDNGNYGVPAYYPKRPDRISRAMEVRIDPVAMTYETVWTWGDELNLFSGSMGDVDPLPQTGNMLVTYGNPSGVGPKSAIVYEVTRAGDIVWEASTSSGIAWFRGSRWSGIIPGPGR